MRKYGSSAEKLRLASKKRGHSVPRGSPSHQGSGGCSGQGGKSRLQGALEEIKGFIAEKFPQQKLPMKKGTRQRSFFSWSRKPACRKFSPCRFAAHGVALRGHSVCTGRLARINEGGGSVSIPALFQRSFGCMRKRNASAFPFLYARGLLLSLVVQRLNGLELAGFVGGVQTEHHADEDGKPDGHPRNVDGNRQGHIKERPQNLD